MYRGRQIGHLCSNLKCYIFSSKFYLFPIFISKNRKGSFIFSFWNFQSWIWSSFEWSLNDLILTAKWLKIQIIVRLKKNRSPRHWISIAIIKYDTDSKLDPKTHDLHESWTIEATESHILKWSQYCMDHTVWYIHYWYGVYYLE